VTDGPEAFRPQTLDFHVRAGDTASGHGAVREPDDPSREGLQDTIFAGEMPTIDLFYRDYEGGQRTIRRFILSVRAAMSGAVAWSATCQSRDGKRPSPWLGAAIDGGTVRQVAARLVHQCGCHESVPRPAALTRLRGFPLPDYGFHDSSTAGCCDCRSPNRKERHDAQQTDHLPR
jgi:hypothetical protein